MSFDFSCALAPTTLPISCHTHDLAYESLLTIPISGGCSCDLRAHSMVDGSVLSVFQDLKAILTAPSNGRRMPLSRVDEVRRPVKQVILGGCLCVFNACVVFQDL